MTLAQKLYTLHEILMSLPDTPEREFKIKVLEEAANALIFVDYMNVKDQFAEYIASSKKPLTSIQKLIVKEMFMTSESNPQEEK